MLNGAKCGIINAKTEVFNVKMMDFIKGMAAGMVAGAAVCALCMPVKKKTAKNVIAGALRSAGDAVESLSEMLGF